MARPSFHNATITLKLPLDLDSGAELKALQAAGIPVDRLGVAESGFLFIRASRDCQSRIFRWFATGISQRAPSVPAPRH
jgi:hypothetical protein